MARCGNIPATIYRPPTRWRQGPTPDGLPSGRTRRHIIQTGTAAESNDLMLECGSPIYVVVVTASFLEFFSLLGSRRY
jgi:hypothetical protein